VLVHALGELLRRAGAVVAPRRVAGVLGVVGLEAAVLRVTGEGLAAAAAAAEEAGHGVPDGGAYCDTAFRLLVSSERREA